MTLLEDRVVDRRPEVASFIERDSQPPSDFVALSKDFHGKYSDCLTDGVGVISQVRRDGSRELAIGSSVETILFDASNKQEGAYLWQLTRANRDGRKIWQLEGSDGGTTGRLFEIDSQGRLVGSSDLSDEDKDRFFTELSDLLVSPEVEANIKEKVDQKTRAGLVLAEFKRDKTIDVLVDNVEGVKEKHIVPLDEEAYKKELLKRDKTFNGIGFVASKPYQPV